MKKFNKTIYGTYGHAIYGHRSMILRDWFSSAEWNITHPMITLSENRSKYESIETEFLEEVPIEKSCFEIKFEEKEGINPPNRL